MSSRLAAIRAAILATCVALPTQLDAGLGEVVMKSPLEQARSAHEAGNLNSALELYEVALAKNPQDHDARMGRVFALLELHRTLEAVDELERALQADKETPGRYVQLVPRYDSRINHPGLEGYAAELLEETNESLLRNSFQSSELESRASAFETLSDVFEDQLGRPSEARLCLDLALCDATVAIFVADEKPSPIQERGHILRMLENKTGDRRFTLRRIEDLKQLALQYPDDPSYQIDLAHAYSEVGKAELALQQWNKVLAHDEERKSDSDNFVARARVFLQLDDCRAALEDVARAKSLRKITVEESFAWRYTGETEGLAYLGLKQFDKAIQSFTTEIEQAAADRENPPEQSNGLTSEAIVNCARVSTIDSLIGRGRAFALTGDDAKALRDFQAAIDVADDWNERVVDVLAARSEYYVQRRQFDTALADLKEAISLDPNSAAAHWRLGELYRQTGKMDLAEEHQRRALKIDPVLADDPPK